MSRTVRHIVRDMRSREAGAKPGAAPALGADLRLMRQLNRLLVLNCVRRYGPIARVTIARRTGLSRTTVSSIMDTLLIEGIVREGDTQDATPSGGRRAILVHFNAAAGYVLGVDMGRSHLTIVLSDLAAQVVASRSGPFDVALGPGACLPVLIAELNAFLAERGVTWSRVIGVGLGIPGPFDARHCTLVRPPRMPGWDGVNVCRILSRGISVPIFLDNDANMGALGEISFGAGRGVADLAYVKIGTGIGSGLVMGGKVYRGSSGSAGEIGHVTVEENGPLCDCGNRGCLEALAGAQAIVCDVRHAGCQRVIAASGASSTDDTAECIPDIAEVVRCALAGGEVCRAAIARAGERIGVVLAGLVNTTNPSVILVDGGVARAGDLLLDPIRAAVAARGLPAASAHTSILAGALGANAVALGGVATVLDAAFAISTDSQAQPIAALDSAGLGVSTDITTDRR